VGGFHASANSVSTVVASGALRPRLAVLWASAVAVLTVGVRWTLKAADLEPEPASAAPDPRQPVAG
jgi:hypothetical protein